MSSKKALHDNLQLLQTNISTDFQSGSSIPVSTTHSSISNRLIQSPKKEILKLPLNMQPTKRLPKSIEQGGNLYRKIQYNLNSQSSEKIRTPSGQKVKTLARIYAENPTKTPILSKIFNFSSPLSNTTLYEKNTERKNLIRSYEHAEVAKFFKANKNSLMELGNLNNTSVPSMHHESKPRRVKTTTEELEKYFFPKLDDLKKRDSLSDYKHFYELKNLFYEALNKIFGRENIFERLFEELEELFMKIMKSNNQLLALERKKRESEQKHISLPEDSMDIAHLKEKLNNCLKTLDVIKKSNLPIDKIFDYPLRENIDRLIPTRDRTNCKIEDPDNRRPEQTRKEKSPFKLNLNALKSTEKSKEPPSDFQDEFWSKINEFSQSWRDAGERERKI